MNNRPESFVPLSVPDFKKEFAKIGMIMPFYYLEDYFKAILDQLNHLEKGEKARIESELAKIHDEDEWFAKSSMLFEEHYGNFEDIFPKMFAYSFITMIYTSVKTNFNKFQKYLCKKGKCNLKIKDFNGSLSEKVKNFCKAFGFKGLKDEDYITLEDFSKIRNKIVHTNGYISRDDKVNIVIEKDESLKIITEKLEVDPKYCFEKLEYFREMFVKLLKTQASE